MNIIHKMNKNIIEIVVVNKLLSIFSFKIRNFYFYVCFAFIIKNAINIRITATPIPMRGAGFQMLRIETFDIDKLLSIGLSQFHILSH